MSDTTNGLNVEITNSSDEEIFTSTSNNDDLISESSLDDIPSFLMVTTPSVVENEIANEDLPAVSSKIDDDISEIDEEKPSN